MLRSLTIKNFRGFRELKIEPLARVNLIAGKNNVGKTGVLEALYLLFSNANQFSQFPSAFRSSQEKVIGLPDEQEKKDNFESFWRWTPHLNDHAGQIEVLAKDGNEDWMRTEFSVRLDEQSVLPPINNLTFHYDRNGSIVFSRAALPYGQPEKIKALLPVKVCSTRHTPPTEDAELFNSLALKKKKKTLIELLRKIEPRLEDLDYLKIGSEPLVYVDVGLKEMIPMTQLGQGFTRLFRFFSEMLVEEAKIILIDEIENGIHHSALADVWAGIAEIAEKEDLQIFATTHSWESIEAAHSVFQSREHYDFALHRLQMVKGEIQVVTHDQRMIEVAEKTDLEIR
ncbi:MAG: AAA family ATPase [Acidobacteriota bacterium]|nr:AAA family ATPase [Acidobacteriota bacterium]